MLVGVVIVELADFSGSYQIKGMGNYTTDGVCSKRTDRRNHSDSLHSLGRGHFFIHGEFVC